MHTMYDPAEKGFDEALRAIDRAQLVLARELSHSAGSRLVLKGGMAMRCAVGSLRLTKDIDFDRSPGMTRAALKGQVNSALKSAAALTGLRSPKVDITKDTDTTCRARLAGVLASGKPVRFEVEVSGRIEPDWSHVIQQTVSPPARYTMAPFVVQVYGSQMLAATKIFAAMSANRNAPRDLLDLYDLLGTGANPAQILSALSLDELQVIAQEALGKLGLSTFELAQQELLPFIAPAQRAQLDVARWETMTLEVAQAVGQWAEQAVKLKATQAQAQAQSLEPAAVQASAPRGGHV
jgi:predicted nucleotidyltransferase component of viral defense system